MTEDECLAAFGIRPRVGDLPAIRALLISETARESATQGDGDTELMKLCCVQLFNSGELTDTLLIWRAKEASFDAACSIDIQLLCGSGLNKTKAYLSEQGPGEAEAALLYLTECEAAGDFDDFSPEAHAAWWSRYYNNDGQQLVPGASRSAAPPGVRPDGGPSLNHRVDHRR